MMLLTVYVVFVFIGEVLAVTVGLYFERFTTGWAMPLALTLFFSVLIVSWPLAVRATDRWLPEEEKA